MPNMQMQSVEQEAAMRIVVVKQNSLKKCPLGACLSGRKNSLQMR